MTDTFTDLNGFKLGPFPRPLKGDYVKTVIVISGHGNTGKSTLSKNLLNNSISYIGTDAASMQRDHNIQGILKYLDIHIHDKPEIDLGRFAHFIQREYLSEFMNYFFNKFIIQNKSLNIIVEGYMMTIPEAYILFVNRCKLHKYRVWKLNRIC